MSVAYIPLTLQTCVIRRHLCRGIIYVPWQARVVLLQCETQSELLLAIRLTRSVPEIPSMCLKRSCHNLASNSMHAARELTHPSRLCIRLNCVVRGSGDGVPIACDLDASKWIVCCESIWEYQHGTERVGQGIFWPLSTLSQTSRIPMNFIHYWTVCYIELLESMYYCSVMCVVELFSY